MNVEQHCYHINYHFQGNFGAPHLTSKLKILFRFFSRDLRQSLVLPKRHFTVSPSVQSMRLDPPRPHAVTRTDNDVSPPGQ